MSISMDAILKIVAVMVIIAISIAIAYAIYTGSISGAENFISAERAFNP